MSIFKTIPKCLYSIYTKFSYIYLEGRGGSHGPLISDFRDVVLSIPPISAYGYFKN